MADTAVTLPYYEPESLGADGMLLDGAHCTSHDDAVNTGLRRVTIKLCGACPWSLSGVEDQWPQPLTLASPIAAAGSQAAYSRGRYWGRLGWCFIWCRICWTQ